LTATSEKVLLMTVLAAVGSGVVTNSHAGSVLTFVGPIGFFALVVLWGFFNRRRLPPR